ncbi:MAG: hypothetical protein HFG89_14710 [Dorea sp.]|jgi:hypothetical protein|nr:hypothetical protein [Dorea sp.]
MKYFSKKNSDCPCKDYNEYELRLKCMKTKLHSRYIVCIAIGIVVWSLATGEANSSEFSDWISFASTITSIILSVIAIILSITGESKMDAMRNQMEETASKLEETANAINNANSQNIKNVEELKENISLLEEKIEAFQGETKEALNQYQKSNRYDYSNVLNTKINPNFTWG